MLGIEQLGQQAIAGALPVNGMLGGALPNSTLAKKRANAASSSSVLGKIVCVDARNSDKVSQFGGVEVYLAITKGHGAALCVRGSRHKRGDATFFPLSAIHAVHGQPKEGKVTVEADAPGGLRRVHLFITTTDPQSMAFLEPMYRFLVEHRRNPKRWAELEVVDAAAAARRRGRQSDEQQDGEAGVQRTNKSARDAHIGLETVAPPPEEDDESEDDEALNPSATFASTRRKQESKAAAAAAAAAAKSKRKSQLVDEDDSD